MDKKQKNFKIQRVLLLIIEFAFVLLGFGNTIYQIIANFKSTAIVSGINNLSTIIYFISYIAIIYYCIWGYKKKYFPYRVALTLYNVSLTIALARLFIDFMPGNLSIFFSASIFLIIIQMALTMTYDNTFKDHKTTAKIIGGIMVLLELLISFGTYYIITHSGIVAVDDVLSFQPFSRFFIIATLYCAFITRTQWRENDKLINEE